MIFIQSEELTKKLILTDNINNPEIKNFLIRDERARIYHHPVWIKSLCDSYGGTPYYIISTDNETEKITGVFPFILFNSDTRSRKKVISLPFTNYCDILLPGVYNIRSIIEAIEKQLGPVKFYDFRNLNEEKIDGFSISNDFLLHIIELKPTPEETYKSFGKRSIRRFITKADENNLSFKLGETEQDFRIFYALEVKLRKSIGLPPAPFHFFHNIWSNLKNENMVFLPIVSYNDEPIVASLVFRFKDRIYFEYTGMNKKFKNLYGNHKIHWEMIKIAQEKFNIKYVELGRVSAKNKDLIFFKENWNAKPFNIYHKRFPSQKDSPPFLARIKEIMYPTFVKLNKKLPNNFLEFEGRIIYKYLKIVLIISLLNRHLPL